MTASNREDATATAKQESALPDGSERTKARKVFVPHVDIVENDTALILIADLPGVDLGGVDVTVEKNVLTLHGHIADDVPAGYKQSYEEYGLGDYERSFTLTNEVDRDGIQASIKDGVLRLTLPKVKQTASRKISVVAG
jgi:HSP20 family molecular chaperone IbpA